MTRRRLVIALPRDSYAALEERARAEEREPSQQAAYELRRLLDAPGVQLGLQGVVHAAD